MKYRFKITLRSTIVQNVAFHHWDALNDVHKKKLTCLRREERDGEGWGGGGGRAVLDAIEMRNDRKLGRKA